MTFSVRPPHLLFCLITHSLSYFRRNSKTTPNSRVSFTSQSRLPSFSISVFFLLNYRFCSKFAIFFVFVLLSYIVWRFCLKVTNLLGGEFCVWIVCFMYLHGWSFCLFLFLYELGMLGVVFCISWMMITVFIIFQSSNYLKGKWKRIKLHCFWVGHSLSIPTKVETRFVYPP